jgi:hypothetical protein
MAMVMPLPTEQHERLAQLAGTWSGEETLHPSPWDRSGGQAHGTIEARMACDGFFLIADYVERREGRVTLRGHGVYGWDPRIDRYTMHWFDSLGDDPGPPALGTWEGDRLVFEREDPDGHTRYVYQLGDRQYSFRIEFSPDGELWKLFMHATYLRMK